jgi:DNA-binding XRE family transcriptional regulator
MPRTPKNADFLQIKQFRERKHLKQKDLADALGVNPVTVTNWENGHRDPPFWAVKRFFEMGATVEELFGVKAEVSELPSKSEFEKQVEVALVKMIRNGSVVLNVKEK